jgi:nitronate monooxygenase
MKPPGSTLALEAVLGIERPILGAPMARVAGARLAAAVSGCGALGFIGGGYGDLDWIDAELSALDPSSIGVGLITWRLDEEPAVLDHVVAAGPRAVWLSYGDPTPHLETIHAAGLVAVCQVLDLDSAVAARHAGADVIVVQGSEAGGHGRPGRGLLTLLPAVVDQISDIPVVAAGGIATGRQLAACWQLGAAGIALGTRLYATHEAADSTAAKRRLVELRGDDTMHSTVFDRVRGPRWPEGYTGRAATNSFVREWHGAVDDLEADLARQRDRYAAGVAADDLDVRVLWAGEAVDLIDDVQPAAAVIREIHGEAADL